MLVELVKFGLILFIIWFVWSSIKDTEMGDAARKLIKTIKEWFKRDDNKYQVQSTLPQVQQPIHTPEQI